VGVRKIGYDRRALALQAAIAAGLLVASRFLPSGFNMNYAYQDLVFHRSWDLLRTPRRDFSWSSRASLLADSSSLELDVSGGRRCEMK